ncbi:hypothetical protein BSK59_13255 [Paenibacillus odorifer]|uniref:hypothetical protein n=1 Tax=Paenibacillus odorifer TaxID=189426 RepID=UPI00096F161C|nr:hypothetical protein [Paenibacillus odorifer]OME55439.1 hypothetical protein BSK59_13255 [Paenibacillus odorifer]
MNEKLSYGEKQLILYSKGHYKTKNKDNALRIITSWNYHIPLESTEQYHIYDYILKVFICLQEEGYTLSPHEFLKSFFTIRRPVITFNTMIEILLIEISLVEVKELNLGEIDKQLFELLNP